MQHRVEKTSDTLLPIGGTLEHPMLVQLPAKQHPISTPSGLPDSAGPLTANSPPSNVVSNQPVGSSTTGACGSALPMNTAKPALENCDGIFIRLERLPESTLKALSEIYERLSHKWDQNDSSHLVHYVRAGIASNELLPALLIECGDQRHKKNLECYLRKQRWLKRTIQEKAFNIFVIGGNFSLSTGLHCESPPGTSVLRGPNLLLSHGAQTLCGSAVRIPSQDNTTYRICTFGGLIVVRDCLFGLLPRHPFGEGQSLSERRTGPSFNIIRDQSDTSLMQIRASEPVFCLAYEDYFEDSDGSEDLYDLADVSIQSQHNSDDHVLDELTADTAGENKISAATFDQSTPENDLMALRVDVLFEQTPPTDRDSQTRSNYDRDWALADFSKLSLNDQKRIGLPNRVGGKLVESMLRVDDFKYGSVKVAPANSTELDGHLLGSVVTIHIQGHCYFAHLLSLEKPLESGCSGAWVVHESQLCGFIIAVEVDIPWGYMVPIEAVREDIANVFQISFQDVRLPTGSELAELDYSLPAQSLPASESLYDQPQVEVGKMDAPFQHSEVMKPLIRARRISTACGACKQRKTKCSGGNPCDACAARRSLCEYDLPSEGHRKKARHEDLSAFAAVEARLERSNRLLGGIIATIRAGDVDANENLVSLIRSGVNLSQLAAHVRNECRTKTEVLQAFQNIDFSIDGDEEMPSLDRILNQS